MNFEIEPKAFFKFNLTIIISLILIHIVVSFIGFTFGSFSLLYGLFDLKRYFHLDLENNIPTAYQGLMIFTSSVLLFLLSSNAELKKNKLYFRLLSYLFFYMAWDELFCLHEQLIGPFREIFNTSRYFYFAWVIPYGVLVLIVALFLFNFIKTLPFRIRNIMILSGIVYVVGELGCELLGGNIIFLYQEGASSPIYRFLYFFFRTTEESLGLLGILIFNYALLSLLKMNNARVLVKFN